MLNDFLANDLSVLSLDKKLDLIEEIGESLCFTETQMKILENLSFDNEDEVRARVAEILVLSDNLSSEEILIKLLNDKSELVRVNACDSLCTSKSKEVFNLLKNKILNDKSSLVRGYAALSILDIAININYNTRELIEFIRTMLEKEKNSWVKINYYKVLYILGDKSYFKILLHELNNRSYRNRCLTAKTLYELITEGNSKEIELALSRRLKNEKTIVVRSQIQEILHKLQMYKNNQNKTNK